MRNSHHLSNRVILGGIGVSAFTALIPRELADAAVLLWSLLCSGLILLGAQRLEGSTRNTFRLLGLAGLVFLVGIVVRTAHGEAIGVEQPLPSPADFFHVPGYLMFFGVAWNIHRRRARSRDIDAWVDSLAFSVAVGSILWGIFLGDFVLNSENSILEVGLHLGYNAVIFAIMAVVIRIGASPGDRPRSYYLLGLGSLAFVIADLNATWASTTSQTAYVTIALSPMIYGFCAAATVDPTAHLMLRPSERNEIDNSKSRAAFVLIAFAAPFAIVLFPGSASMLAQRTALGGSVIVAFLVSFRVYRVLLAERASQKIERQLSEELSSMAKLTSTDELRRSLVGAASRLVSDGARPRITTQETDGRDVTTFEIPESLQGQSPEAMEVSPPLVSAQQKRLVSTLLRDAGHMATALSASAAIARQESEAAANERIAINERRFRALVQNASDLVLVIDHDASITYMSEASQRILGREADGCVGLDVRELLIHGDVSNANRYVAAVFNGSPPAHDLEVRLQHSDGSTRLFECAFTDMFNVEGVNGLVINATDVTNQRTLERDLLNAATTDHLTLMLNRSAFINEISSAMRSASLTGAGVSVAIINIDNFRQLNESLGPVLADQVLINSSHAIRRSVRLADSVARLSGGEFAVLFPTVSETSEAAALVERVLEELAIPMSVGDKDLVITARAGISTGGDAVLDAPALVRQADTALDTARRTANHRVVLYEEEMGEAVSERIDIRDRLNGSIDNGELRLVYQPIVDFATGDIVSMESLARWEHPERGNIPPDVFIPIAESSGYIDKLGDWALETACLQLIEWNDLGLVGLTISVNISAHQIRANDIVDRVQSILRRTGVDPTLVVIEITESVLIDDTDFIASRINALRGLGLGLAIDDFGTGYSSLSYLQRYAFDILKIDRSFVTDLDQAKNARRAEVVRSIVSLAKGLGALTVAEGVEEESERRELKKLGCDRAQGFLFYTPVEASEVPAILAAKSNSLRAA